MPTDHFAGSTAITYDADHAERFTSKAVEPAVDFLAALAGDRPALEFAIGTGRIALPLQARGVDVDGTDFSAAMLEQFDAKPRSESINTVASDMAQVAMERTYGLVYLVFNTIGNLTTQDAQVACFRNAAQHLDPGGHFVVESNVPNLRRLTPGAHGCVFGSTDDHVGIDHYTDLVEQQAVSRHFHFDGMPGKQRVGVASVRYEETPFRFTWPSELDLMAQLAGMHRVERWADWYRNDFVGDSPAHISVWRKD
jgi:SAM-dependent methyltransferase